MPDNEVATPKADGTPVGQWILKLAGIVIAIGILGGVIGDAINKWAWISEAVSWVATWFGPDCGDFSKLSREEIEICLQQQE